MKKKIFGSQISSDAEMSDTNKPMPEDRTWHQPISCEVKVIDFGGGTYKDEKHTPIINTRQYRAPEVILENKYWNKTSDRWNEKSDLWSMACILVELYTGELFFDTHENVEHLAMIEKQCGPIPKWMAEKCD